MLVIFFLTVMKIVKKMEEAVMKTMVSVIIVMNMRQKESENDATPYGILAHK